MSTRPYIDLGVMYNAYRDADNYNLRQAQLKQDEARLAEQARQSDQRQLQHEDLMDYRYAALEQSNAAQQRLNEKEQRALHDANLKNTVGGIDQAVFTHIANNPDRFGGLNPASYDAAMQELMQTDTSFQSLVGNAYAQAAKGDLGQGVTFGARDPLRARREVLDQQATTRLGAPGLNSRVNAQNATNQVMFQGSGAGANYVSPIAQVSENLDVKAAEITGNKQPQAAPQPTTQAPVQFFGGEEVPMAGLAALGPLMEQTAWNSGYMTPEDRPITRATTPLAQPAPEVTPQRPSMLVPEGAKPTAPADAKLNEQLPTQVAEAKMPQKRPAQRVTPKLLNEAAKTNDATPIVSEAEKVVRELRAAGGKISDVMFTEKPGRDQRITQIGALQLAGAIDPKASAADIQAYIRNGTPLAAQQQYRDHYARVEKLLNPAVTMDNTKANLAAAQSRVDAAKVTAQQKNRAELRQWLKDAHDRAKYIAEQKVEGQTKLMDDMNATFSTYKRTKSGLFSDPKDVSTLSKKFRTFIPDGTAEQEERFKSLAIQSMLRTVDIMGLDMNQPLQREELKLAFFDVATAIEEENRGVFSLFDDDSRVPPELIVPMMYHAYIDRSPQSNDNIRRMLVASEGGVQIYGRTPAAMTYGSAVSMGMRETEAKAVVDILAEDPRLTPIDQMRIIAALGQGGLQNDLANGMTLEESVRDTMESALNARAQKDINTFSQPTQQ